MPTARNAARSNFDFVSGNFLSKRRIAAASTPAPQFTAKYRPSARPRWSLNASSSSALPISTPVHSTGSVGSPSARTSTFVAPPGSTPSATSVPASAFTASLIVPSPLKTTTRSMPSWTACPGELVRVPLLLRLGDLEAEVRRQRLLDHRQRRLRHGAGDRIHDQQDAVESHGRRVWQRSVVRAHRPVAVGCAPWTRRSGGSWSCSCTSWARSWRSGSRSPTGSGPPAADRAGGERRVFALRTVSWIDGRLTTPAYVMQAVTGVILIVLIGTELLERRVARARDRAVRAAHGARDDALHTAVPPADRHGGTARGRRAGRGRLRGLRPRRRETGGSSSPRSPS